MCHKDKLGTRELKQHFIGLPCGYGVFCSKKNKLRFEKTNTSDYYEKEKMFIHRRIQQTEVCGVTTEGRVTSAAHSTRALGTGQERRVSTRACIHSEIGWLVCHLESVASFNLS